MKFYFIVYLRILWIVEISNNSNEKIDYLYRDEHDDDRNASFRPEDTKAITQDPSNIDQRICERDILTNQDDFSSDLYNGAFSRNDEANSTPTSSINATS